MPIIFSTSRTKRVQPCILKLQLDAISFTVLDDLRQRYFPKERNFISPHVTLFHRLPAHEEANIVMTLQSVCSETPILSLSFSNVRFLGTGVAIEVKGQDLFAMRKWLVSVWWNWLRAQERKDYRLHVTIQNKVSRAEARHLFENMQRTWQPFIGKAAGLQLWRYRGGPWTLSKALLFEKE